MKIFIVIHVCAEVAASFKHVPTTTLPLVKHKKKSDPFPVNVNGLLSNVRMCTATSITSIMLRTEINTNKYAHKFIAAVNSKNYAEAAAIGEKSKFTIKYLAKNRLI